MARILIVDDDPIGREQLATLIRKGGHETLEASDGSDALERVRRDRPQLVICDILLATMDAQEFLRRLRAEPEFANVEIIFRTASFHKKAALHLAQTSQVRGVLTTTAEATEILRAIEDVLAGKAVPMGEERSPGPDTGGPQNLDDLPRHCASELEAVKSRLDAIAELHVQVASEFDPNALRERVCIGVRKLFGAQYAVLAARDISTDRQTNFAVSGLDTAVLQSERPSLESGALWRVLRGRTPWRASRDDGNSIDSGLPRIYPPAQACLAVPIASLTESYGWIYLANKVGETEFTQEDEKLLANFGAQIGRVYESAYRYHELQSRVRQLQEDLAQRERATASLRASEERFRQLAEHIQDVFFVASIDLSELYYLSPAYSQIWGQSNPSAASCAEILMEGIHFEDADRVRAEFHRIGAEGSAGTLEYRIVRSDRSVRQVLVRTFPVLEPEASSSRIVGTAIDVTADRDAAAYPYPATI